MLLCLVLTFVKQMSPVRQQRIWVKLYLEKESDLLHIKLFLDKIPSVRWRVQRSTQLPTLMTKRRLHY